MEALLRGSKMKGALLRGGELWCALLRWAGSPPRGAGVMGALLRDGR